MKTIQTLHMVTLTGALFAGCLAVSAEETKQPQMSKEQTAMMDAMQRAGEVRPQHKQLAFFVGDWNVTTSMYMDPKAPPQKSEGKAHIESLFGGRYVRTNFEGSFAGETFNGEGLMGFDNTAGKFFNTWIDSGSTGMSIAWGTYDAASKSYTFRTEMDDHMKPGTKFPVREVMHVVDDTHYTFDWYETHGGKEVKTMQIAYAKR
ncbi:MAG: DUF1579 domain-containing protein [Rudaea sp.]